MTGADADKANLLRDFIHNNLVAVENYSVAARKMCELPDADDAMLDALLGRLVTVVRSIATTGKELRALQPGKAES